VWVTGIGTSTASHAGVQFSSTATLLPSNASHRAALLTVPK